MFEGRKLNYHVREKWSFRKLNNRVGGYRVNDRDNTIRQPNPTHILRVGLGWVMNSGCQPKNMGWFENVSEPNSIQPVNTPNVILA